MALRYCAQPACHTLVSVGYCHAHGARPNADVRKLYRTARWRALRALVQREQPLCDECDAEGRTVAGTDVDHTQPHRGDVLLFWDRANLSNKCAMHHAMKTRRGE